MKKLTLKLDALEVESFEAVGREERRGTVYAHEGTYYGETCITQCATGPCICQITEGFSCDGGC